MKNFILITRPAEDAEEFAREVQALGFSTMTEAMIGICPIPFKMPDISKYSGLIFTSANAVRVLGKPASLNDITIFAVGSHTADEARKLGYSKVFSAEGDAVDLGAVIKKKVSDVNCTLLHVRGEHIARPLSELLKGERINVDEVIVYTAKTENKMTESCKQAIADGRIEAVTFFSRRTAESFAEMIEAEALKPCLSEIKALCISPSVLECVQVYPWKKAYSADRPDRASMLSLLKKVCGS